MANSLKPLLKNNLNIAIIMDGNGRWALSNSLNISKGHQKGVQVVKDIVQESVQQKISSLTLYAFSSENWSRPKAEIEAIKKLVITAIEEQVPELIEQKVKLTFFGRHDNFGKKISDKIKEAELNTNTLEPSLNLNVALGYGGRQDIVDLTKNISSRVLAKEINIDDINEEMVSNFSCVPQDKIDLLIRTGGDKRISNFLLYQIAYAEIFFIDKYWPDFEKDDFISCINKFNKVSRRFGARV
ncbi:polyprenyl diphosphate synthase [Gammaproteobacteria bacterium]|nr:polyprenyl diphosphate synthase [Gammaproteobacteria bacterium]